MICSKLEGLLYPAVQLLLYLDELDVEDFYGVCVRTSLSTERVIETKCGNVQSAIYDLLGFSNPRKIQSFEFLQFTPDKAYYVEVQGIDILNNTLTMTGHGFILINDGRDWLMIDSYIGCRGFTCRTVVLASVLEALSLLQQKFSDKIWVELTGCHDDARTDRVDVLIYQYDYAVLGIDNRFTELIRLAKHRLNSTEVGLSDEYLSLIAVDLNPQTANDYLDGLFDLL